MKLLRNTSKKKRAKAHQTVFVFDIHRISPWPALHGPLIVEWQRGSKRRGQSHASDPDSDDPSRPTTYNFGAARFEIPATLYESKENEHGIETKVVNLFVCQVNEKGKVGNMVGGVTLDLAKLDVLTKVPARQEYFIECSQSIVDMSGGRPKLIMDLWKMSGDGEEVLEHPRNEEHAAEDNDMPSRLSTDVPSSQGSPSKVESMVTVVSPSGRVELEKDVGKHVEGRKTMYDQDGFLIDEDEDIEEVLDRTSMENDDVNMFISPKINDNIKEDGVEVVRKRFDTLGPFGGHGVEDDEEVKEQNTAVNVETDISLFQASKQMPIHTRRFSRDINSSFGSVRQLQGEDHPSPRPCTSPPKPSVASCNSAMQGQGSLQDDTFDQYHGMMKRKLQVFTALEMSVWNAGFGWGDTRHGTIPRRDKMQAPARRMARTVIRLGEQQGIQFMKEAITSIKHSCVASLGDLQKSILWWSTMVTLRWSFWTLVDESRPRHMRMIGFEWLQKNVLTDIVSCEEWLFSRIVSNLWTCHVQVGLEQCRQASDMEHLIAKYTDLLDEAMNIFEDTSRPSPCSKTIKNVLKKLVLRDISVKLDVALFKDLLGQHISIFCPLTSAQGLELKILADRISAWFESNGISSQDEDRDAEKVWCLRRILSAANVIVTPKPALLDAEVRKEIAPKISVTSICDMLTHYKQIEEDSREQNVEEIVRTLREKASTKIDLNESEESFDFTTYHAPNESWITQQGIIQPLSLDMDSDSDSELEDVVGHERAMDLKELWTSHAREQTKVL